MARLGLDYPTAWGRGAIARGVRAVIQRTYMVPYAKHLSMLTVRGLDHLDVAGPLIFVANHASNLDAPLVISSLPPALRKRLVVAAAMDTFFMHSWSAFKTVLMFNGIPIDRHKVNRRSSQLALELIEDHWNLLIFPEGGRTPDGDLQEFKGGAAYLADRARTTVIPTYIHESGLLQGPKYAKAPRFVNAPSQHRHHVIVAFGEALHLEDGENIRRFNSRIESAVQNLGRVVSGDDSYGVKPATA